MRRELVTIPIEMPALECKYERRLALPFRSIVCGHAVPHENPIRMPEPHSSLDVSVDSATNNRLQANTRWKVMPFSEFISMDDQFFECVWNVLVFTIVGRGPMSNGS